MINWVASGVLEAGAEVEIVDAVRLENKTNGCIGCRDCKRSDYYRCVIKDETSSLIVRTLEKDVVVFATPVYFGSFPAQMKRLVDRMYCLIKIRDGSYFIEPALKDVSLALIATAGGDEKYGLSLFSAYMRDFCAAGFGKGLYEFLLPSCPSTPGEMKSNLKVRHKAIAFGRQLVQRIENNVERRKND